MATPSSSLHLKPHFPPRDLWDYCLSHFVVFPFQALGLFIMPGLLGYLLFRSWHAAWIIPLVVYSAFLAFSVWSITLTDAGIRFHRLLGGPKFLPWDAVQSIEVAPRWELIRLGWLWPLFPAREMTPSFTSLHHYRITWKGGFCHFPPADITGFEQYVRIKVQSRPQ